MANNTVIFGLLILAAGIIGGLFLSKVGAQAPSRGVLTRASHTYSNDESWDFVEREDGTFSIKVHRKADVN